MPDAYKQFLLQFPNSGIFWKSLIEYYIQRDELTIANELFNKSLQKCRSVPLWQTYVLYIRKKISRVSKGDTSSSSSSSSNGVGMTDEERKMIESSYEKALDNIGPSVQADDLWRDYITFIKEWPESTNIESSRKLMTLRKVYQRALTIPTDSLDSFWREYEAIERTAGEHLADKVLPEFNEKYLHAKAIFKDRYKFTSKINFDRLAAIPVKSLPELQQLDYWNKWIKYEMTNPDNLPPDSFKNMIRMVYDQCLCCYLQHPEVWLGYARFEHVYSSIDDARVIYKNAVEILPNVTYLRIALAELEESLSNYTEAREVLRSCYEMIPSSLSFAVYQRFLRRTDGIVAARKLFSDSLPRRVANVFGLEVYLVHAQIELEVNCCPEIAVKVLDLGKAAYPACYKEYNYVHLLTQALIRLGDLHQIQWVFHVALGCEALSVAHAKTNFIGLPATSSSTNTNTIMSGFADKATQENIVSTGRPLQETLMLWEEYLEAEMKLGLSNVSHINEIRSKRDKARTLFDERHSARNAVSSTSNNSRVFGLYESPYELSERYDSIVCAKPVYDEDLRQRSNGRVLLNELSRQESERMAALREAGVKQKGKRKATNAADDSAAADEFSNLTGVPSVLKDLLPKLPANIGPVPDLQGFIKHLRGLVLPPRPTVAIEESDLDSVSRTSWQTSMYDNEDDNDDLDDIFRRRQKMRLGYV